MNNNIQKSNRTKIIEISTKIFYENGYNKTSFEKIAKHCEITKGLITYHFRTKANLAKEVVLKYNINIKNTIDEKIYNTFADYNIYYSTVACQLILNQLYKNDEKALQFYLEYLNSGFENQYLNGFLHFYKILDRHYHLDINRKTDEFNMLSTASMFSSLSLFYSFFTGKINCTYDEFIDCCLRLQFKIMNIDDENTDYIIKEGKKIANQLDYKIGPYFTVL